MRKRLMMYFSFSKSEYNGLMVLIVLIMVVTALPAVYDSVWTSKDDLRAEQKALQQLIYVNATDHAGAVGTKSDKVGGGKVKPVLSRFDPNRIDAEGWQALGLSEKQSAAILKYRAKGGRFYHPQDLRKMYTISGLMYEKLAPYITIAEDSLTQRDREGGKSHVSFAGSKYAAKDKYTMKDKYAAKEYPIIELNTADTLLLDQIKGIGPAFARRIVKYRERLGGFYKKEQLMEVFGLDSLLFESLKNQVTVDSRVIIKININTATFDDLKNNPYLKYKQVNAIVQFRKQHGNYSNIADLNKVAILSAETVERLAPYISFSHD